MMRNNNRIELLAPAGNLEKMKTAFAFGADAVYLGIPDYSLRARINDFDLKSVKKAVDYAHKMEKRVYATFNIFAHEDHFKKLPGIIREMKKMKVDALVISDPGILSAVKKIWPKAIIHLSTQANCINSSAAKFWFKEGVSRIVLGRETSLKDIKAIKKAAPKLELEYFVHGAMCMAYSGRCFLSKYLTGRSANLGDCVQPCRWPYQVKSKKLEVKSEKLIIPDGVNGIFELYEEDGYSYILNSKDLCLIKHLRELAEAGVTSFKIEGRTKSVYYIATVVGAYKKAMENLSNAKLVSRLQSDLEEKIFNRGYTTGFLFNEGKLAQNLATSKENCDWEFCGQVVKIKKLEVRNKKYLLGIKVHNTLRVGEEIEIVSPVYDIIKMKLNNMTDAETGEYLAEAHGGSDRVILIESNFLIPEFSVLRRLIKHAPDNRGVVVYGL
ncbi:MAG: U32 family peptidase C-terminal domain-containing protein [Patescibacteria group bacterium]|jgi:putative protease